MDRSPMPNVRLTEHMQCYARTQIEPGAYANGSEVMRAGGVLHGLQALPRPPRANRLRLV